MCIHVVVVTYLVSFGISSLDFNICELFQTKWPNNNEYLNENYKNINIYMKYNVHDFI